MIGIMSYSWSQDVRSELLCATEVGMNNLELLCTSTVEIYD
jgi:hypothetical protein